MDATPRPSPLSSESGPGRNDGADGGSLAQSDNAPDNETDEDHQEEVLKHENCLTRVSLTDHQIMFAKDSFAVVKFLGCAP